jgi:hypothetical protein
MDFIRRNRETQLYALFEWYAQRKSVVASTLRFLHKGDRIRPGQTPNIMKLDDHGEIDCVAGPPVPADVWEALKQNSRAIKSLHVGDDQTRGDTNNSSTTPAASSATNTTRPEPSGAVIGNKSHADTGCSSQSCKRTCEKIPSKEPPNPKPPLADKDFAAGNRRWKKSRCAVSCKEPIPNPKSPLAAEVMFTIRVCDSVRRFAR